MTEKDFLSFLGAVLERPKLYTPTGTFYEIISYLEGYGGGGVVGKHASHSVFTPFLFWFGKKEGYKSIVDWKQFRETFSSDTEALENFQNLYTEYVRSL